MAERMMVGVACRRPTKSFSLKKKTRRNCAKKPALNVRFAHDCVAKPGCFLPLS
jgi:hypothetical protein